MKYSVPEISWHNRDPVLSADFQPMDADSSTEEPRRLATAGTDSHVLIWHIKVSDCGAVTLEVAADLTRHQKAVNVVRWSPSGELLASGDDEAVILLWKQRTDKDPPAIFDQTDQLDKETWIVHKALRGHMEDVLDICWDPTSTRLASGSVDNKLICWDVAKGRHSAIIADHKGFVQGVTWDPNNQYIASMCTDRVFRVFDASTKKVVARSSKATLPVPSSHILHNQPARLYHDDTLQTYFRRLHFSPDGSLIAVPSGHIQPENSNMKPIHAVLVYTRYSLKTPACVVPCGDSSALAVRWSPVTYRPRAHGPPAAFPLQRRMLLAVATKTTLLIYDTQQKAPFALVSNVHYTRLTDLTWSPDGLILVASSTDGFCSVISFAENELGERLVEDLKPMLPEANDDVITAEQNVQTKSLTPGRKQTKPAKRIEIKGNKKLQAFMQFEVNSQKTESTPIDATGPSTDGLCSAVSFAHNELGERLVEDPKPMPTETNNDVITAQHVETKVTTPGRKHTKQAKRIEIKGNKKLQAFMQFKVPDVNSQKTDSNQSDATGPITIDLIDETAMAPWSEDSNSVTKSKVNPPVITVHDDSSEDIKLVYEESQTDR